MAKNETKNASVFEAKLLSRGSYRRLSPRSWDEALRKIREDYSLSEREIDGIYFDPVEQGGKFLLGMHRPVDGAFKTLIDENTSSISDVLPDEVTDRRWAESSAVLFSETHHVFIYAGGGRQGPPAGAVVSFLNHFFPGGKGEHWRVEPYLDRPQIDRLKQAKGLIQFSSRFSTQRDLFTSHHAGEGPAAFADRIAEAVGQDIELEITIKLPKQSRGRQATRKLLELIRGDLSRTVRENSNAKAEAIIDDELTEELSLVAHKMAAKFELNIEDTEQRLFTDLLQGLVEVAPELNSRIQKIEQG